MPNDKSAVDEFLGGLNKPKENPFESQDPFKTQVDTGTEDEDTEEEEKPTPFHKDPKVLRYIEKQVAKATANIKPEPVYQTREEEINLPSSFVRLVGNDTEEKKQVLKDLSSYFGTLKGEARSEFMEEMRQQEVQAQEADNAALEELNQSFEDIEETFGVDLSSNTTAAQRTRAGFVEYLKKVSPKNADGEVKEFADIPNAWEEYQSRVTRSQNTRAKTLAARSMGGSQNVSDTPQQVDRSWKGVEKLFSKLTN